MWKSMTAGTEKMVSCQVVVRRMGVAASLNALRLFLGDRASANFLTWSSMVLARIFWMISRNSCEHRSSPKSCTRASNALRWRVPFS